MNNKTDYKQCGLIKDGRHLVSWLPVRYAVKGKFLKLKNTEWENGWEVISVGDKVMSQSEAIDRSQDYKRTRKASDI